MKIERVFLLCLCFGISTLDSFAQAAVGFVNVTTIPGWNAVALPVHTRSGDTVAQHIRNAPEGSLLVKLLAGDFRTNRVEGGSWLEPEESLATGEGFLFFNPLARDFTMTFAGEVLQGALTNEIPAGLSLRGGRVPREGRLSRDLGLRLNRFDNLYLWKGQSWEVYTFLGEDEWLPTEPVVRAAEGFMVRAASATNSVVQFSVNAMTALSFSNGGLSPAASSGPEFSGPGTVNFANAAAGVLAQVRSAGVGVAGNGWRAQLLREAGEAAVVVADRAFESGNQSGYFFGGRVNLPGSAEGQVATFTVRVLRSGQVLGESGPVTVTLGGGIMPPPNLTGLTAMELGRPLELILAREGGETVLKWPLEHASAKVEVADKVEEGFALLSMATTRTNGNYLALPIESAIGQRYFRLALP